MKFEIHRTSLFSEDIAPCAEAIREEGFRVDERTVSDPKNLRYLGAEAEWYASGINHRVKNRHIMRDFPTRYWVIEINTLEELMKFCECEGEVIINGWSWRAKDLPSIELYDTYRE